MSSVPPLLIALKQIYLSPDFPCSLFFSCPQASRCHFFFFPGLFRSQLFRNRPYPPFRVCNLLPAPTVKRDLLYSCQYSFQVNLMQSPPLPLEPFSLSPPLKPCFLLFPSFIAFAMQKTHPPLWIHTSIFVAEVLTSPSGPPFFWIYWSPILLSVPSWCSVHPFTRVPLPVLGFGGNFRNASFVCGRNSPFPPLFWPYY